MNRYVVGYKGIGQVVYGRDKDGEASFTEPMTTLEEARQMKKELLGVKQKAIFKLVEVEK